MTSESSLTIRPLTPADETRWRELFRGYREFSHLAAGESVVSTVWGWLTEPSHESNALVAEDTGRLIGLAHYRRFSRPSTGTVGIWLDDLFTDPEARGKGAGRALVDQLTRIAGAEGRSVVRWITADDNHQAQGLYDQIAKRTSWVTYDALPATDTAQ